MQLNAETAHTSVPDVSATDRELGAWVDARWVKLLDRIDHRDPDVGLRFWGPPLWLEVTMTGPDSDLWPAVSEQVKAWDWQSNTPCEQVAGLAEMGADDDSLLAIVGRYTIENLILNAVHEIGEWFRFDGQRVFSAHTSRAPDRRDQGNGAVELQVTFADRSPVRAAPVPDDEIGAHLVGRLTDLAAAPRFTYLPATTITYEAAGPAIHSWADRESGAAWRSTWSTSTLDAVVANDPEALTLVAQDVHRALVWHEAGRICRAFHVVGRRPWMLAVPESAPGATALDSDVLDAGFLSLSISYARTSAASDSL